MRVVMTLIFCSVSATAYSDSGKPNRVERTTNNAVQGTERTAKRAGKFVEKTADKSGKFVDRTATKAANAVKRLIE